MQKAIRRGDAKTACRAAATLLLLDPAMLRRRLLVTVAEDVGLGDLVTMTEVSAAMADIAWLRQHGIGRVAALLIHQMAAAPQKP